MRRIFRWLIAFGLLTESCGRLSKTAVTPAASQHTTYSLTVKQPPDSASVEVFVPPGVDQVRAVVAFIARSVDQYAFDDRDWRAMCGRADYALLRIQIPGQGSPAYEPRLIRDAAAGGGAALLRAMEVASAVTGPVSVRGNLD